MTRSRRCSPAGAGVRSRAALADDALPRFAILGNGRQPKGVMLTHGRHPRNVSAWSACASRGATMYFSPCFRFRTCSSAPAATTCRLRSARGHLHPLDPRSSREDLASERPTIMCAVRGFFEKIRRASQRGARQVTAEKAAPQTSWCGRRVPRARPSGIADRIVSRSCASASPARARAARGPDEARGALAAPA